jgi:trimeric autotransporter adhesin
MIMSSNKQKLRLIGAFAALATLALAMSCRGFFVNPTLNSITVGPSSVNVPVGKTQQMAATGSYNDGSTQNITGKSGIVWQSSDESLATISGTGLVTGVAAGSPTITAQLGTISGQATVNVTLSNITSIVVTPSTANISANGGTANFTAEANVSGSSTQIDVSAQVAWTISDTTNFTLTQSVTPETVTAGSGATPGQQVTLTATYTSGTTQYTSNATLTVK